jgi:hypothetical protein
MNSWPLWMRCLFRIERGEVIELRGTWALPIVIAVLKPIEWMERYLNAR